MIHLPHLSAEEGSISLHAELPIASFFFDQR
jgi:hypothetical protein